jgi:lipoprotein-anchoring transpeptidase ErfK/SrfK
MRVAPVTFACIIWLALGTEAYAQKGLGTADRVNSHSGMALDPLKINDPHQQPLMRGRSGSAVLRAQILLARASFSCGQIDGQFGSNLEKTVAAFQAERKLPDTRTIDKQTWAALNSDNAPPLMTYVITPDDEKGPFVNLPADIMAQAKLDVLGYSSPLEELADRFHTSQQVMEALNPAADFSRPDQELTVPNVLTLPRGQAAEVVVSKSESSVTAYDADGKLLSFYVATIGSVHDPLPIGTWKITGVSRNPVFHYNAKLFWDASDKNEKALIRPGPKNPVGLVWIDLSKPHYGIHGTPDPALIGHTTSHGCIRLTNWDALELAAMVKPGVGAELKE